MEFQPAPHIGTQPAFFQAEFVSPSKGEVFMKSKFKLIAAILGLGLTMAIPGAVSAQNPDDQASDQYSKPSAGIQAEVNIQGPSDQGSMDQDAIDNGSTDQGSNDQGSMNQGSTNQGSTQPGYNDQGAIQSSSAPTDTNSGVARVSLIHGDVSTQRGNAGDWSAAALNAPVVAGDRVSTGDKARTELQLDYANMLRLSEHTQANINTLTRSQIQIQLGQGMANYTVLKNSDADAEIDTPNVAIRTNRRESSFRILVTADDHTEVLVRKGEVEITTPQGGTRVGEGQFITVQGAGEQAQYKIGEAPARDDWDQWNTDRDNVIRNAASRRRTNDYYVGAEDLDNHGTWSEVPDYGEVWRPNVADDWAPYRDGRWVDEPNWGWTWVSYDPWGWAPYHYGRWMMYNGGWAWWPGPIYADPFYRPIWAPAYVSFFGYGGGFGFGFGGGWGSVGWLPLGPCDRFHPWYGRYGGRFGETNINISNRGGFAPLHGGTRFSNVNLAQHDQHFRGGTTVSGREFGTGHMRPQPMSHAQFQNAHFSTGRLPVTPSRESFSASGRPAAPSTTRNLSQNQHFFSARGNTAAPRSVQLGRPQVANGNRQDGRSIGNVREAPKPGSTGSNNGFQRFGQPGQNSGQNGVAGSRSTEPRFIAPPNNSVRPQMRGNSNGGSAPARNNGNSNGGGWQRFSPMPARPSSPSTSQSTRQAARPESMIGQGGSTGRPSAGRPSPVRPSMDRAAEDRSPSGYSRGSAPESRGYSSGYGSGSRGYNSQGQGYSGYSRPPLNMRQPIVTPRSYGGGGYSGGSPYGGNRGGYSGGGGRPAPSYGGGGRSAPSYGGGGGHSAPSGGSPHGGGGSSHGGGSSSGGGGRHGR
jgi:hypothetical protein